MANELDGFDDFRENSQLYLDLIKESFQSKETISNDRFDQIFDQKLRRVSSVHWTPVEVALSILELLDLAKGSKVLDVGSGAGKFCLVGALNTKAHFFGVDQRQSLV
jgi:cyclopropane fatty-acyl-phospholipid synthase-like methyltransferase